jgi:hypothetical protein
MTCNGCKKDIVDNNDTLYNSNNDIIFCNYCTNKIYNIYECKYSSDCAICNDYYNGYCVADDLFICLKCYDEKNIKKIIRSLFLSYDESKKYIFCGVDNYLFPIKKYDGFKINLPEKIYENTSNERDLEYISMLEEITESYISDKELLKWTLITDMFIGYDEDLKFGIAVKCEYPYPISYIYCDDTDYMTIDKIYNTFDEYEIDYKKWHDNGCLEILPIIEDQLSMEYDINYKIKTSKSFPEYIYYWSRRKKFIH